MNPSSNHSTYGAPLSSSCLRLAEPCLTHNWSRDLPSFPGNLAPFQLDYFDELASIGEGQATFLPNAPNSATHDGYGLVFESLPLTKSEDGYEEGKQCYAEIEAPGTLSKQVSDIDVDYLAGESSLSSNSTPTVINPSHQRIGSLGEIVCYECFQNFTKKSELDYHAKQTQHRPHACSCGDTFSRSDVLNRHLQNFHPTILYPCSYCTKYSGVRAFIRRDHLTQHLRGYHKFEISSKTTVLRSLNSTGNAKTGGLSCPHEDCLYQKEAISEQSASSILQNTKKGFRTRQEFTKHLREVHDESPYPCNASGCGRSRGRGFFRKRDLVKHQKKHHEDSDSFLQLS